MTAILSIYAYLNPTSEITKIIAYEFNKKITIYLNNNRFEKSEKIVDNLNDVEGILFKNK